MVKYVKKRPVFSSKELNKPYMVSNDNALYGIFLFFLQSTFYLLSAKNNIIKIALYVYRNL